MKPKDNLLVIFEEHGGKPEDVKIVTVKRYNICTFVSESHPAAHVRTWSREESQLRGGDLTCAGDKKVIQLAVVFESFGNPGGSCGNYTVGSYHARQAKDIVEKVLSFLLHLVLRHGKGRN